MIGIDAVVRGSGAWSTTSQSHASYVSHETFIAAVWDIGIARLRPEQGHRIRRVKMVYGKGNGGYRGVTYYRAWQNGGADADDFIEIAAVGEESSVQLAGTTLHEAAHVLAGLGGGHGTKWKAACKALGLNTADAAGQIYRPDNFDPDVWRAIAAVPPPTDGTPVFGGRTRPCPLGIGTRGGHSRGSGSGSRLRLWVCDQGSHPVVRARVASDTFEATCGLCGSRFQRP